MKKRSIAGVIAALKEDQTRPEVGNGRALEDHVRNVYQTLLNLELENAVVGRGVSVRGSRGSIYEIDVYYEFEIAGVRHRVAIECKNRSRAVWRDEVLAFALKVHDCHGVVGIVVSANGYQSGAIQSAQENGLKVLSVDELPSIGQLMALNLDDVTVPGPQAKGQPFWSLFAPENNEPYSFSNGSELFGILFMSRAHAEKYAETCRLSPQWKVRGMETRHLGTYVALCDHMRGRIVVVRPNGRSAFRLNGFEFEEIRRDDLLAEFYTGTPLPKTPLVAPGRRKR